MGHQKSIALVTGATSGFGRAISLSLAKDDHLVLACGRRKDRLRDLESENKNILGLELDITNAQQIFTLQERLKEEDKEPSILINNAGLALGLSTADAADVVDWNRMIETNITGLITMTRAFVPAMKRANRGYIINIGSVAGSNPYPGANVYGATKAFVSQFSNNLRSDFIGTNIRVTCLEPGLAKTEFSQVRFKGDGDKAESVYQGTSPLLAEDIAQIVSWLVSLPEHVNVNSMEIMPTCQAWAPLAVAKNPNQNPSL